MMSDYNLGEESPLSEGAQKQLKFWTWFGYDRRRSDDDWRELFSKMRAAGIDAILPEIFNNHEALYGSDHLPVTDRWLERLLPMAGDAGLEVHAWAHIMTCNIEEVYEQHPEWFNVNRRGESSLEKPG